MGHRSFWLALALLGISVSAPGQDATTQATDDEKHAAAAEQDDASTPAGETPPAPARGGAKPKAKPRDADAPPPGMIRVRADHQEVLEKGHTQFRGGVDLRTSDARINADLVDVYEVDKPDGSKGRKVVASGNVAFIQGDERLAGDRATLDMDTGAGVFENARGFVQTGVLIEGRVIQRLDSGTYRVEGGRFTACTQPDPRWNFKASSATVHTGDKIVASNVVFDVRDVPVFYSPYFVYPITEDQRATGLLFPRIGNSSIRGFTLGEGFFWAMGRSVDQTFYADSYSKSGYGLGHELRWALDRPSHGDFRTYVYSPSQVTQDQWDYDVSWNALQALPAHSRATLDVRRYSDTFFENQVQDNFNLATNRFQTAQVSLQTTLPQATVSVLADDKRVFFSDQTNIQRHLPSVLLRHPAKRLGKSPVVLGLEVRGDELARGDESVLHSYFRFDVNPQLSIPVTTTFLSITPRAVYRYTRYGNSLDTESTPRPTGPALTRRYFEGSVQITGPTFAHVFTNPSGFYSDKFKHVIGPEVTWTYRTPVEDFNLIPKFDGVDQQLGTDQVSYALVQRIYAKRPDANGRSMPFELLSWRIGQTYYVKINEGQNEFDPNYSTGTYGVGGLPDHNSPILSRLSLHPTRDLSADFDVEYDVNFKQIRNLTVGGQIGGPRATLLGSWNTARKVAEDPADRTTIRNFVRGGLSLEVLPSRLSLDGTVNYDFVNEELLQSTARLRWTVQCCGVSAEMIQYHLNTREERIFRFSIDLANVGSMGNFMQDENVPGGPVGPLAVR